jgi:magnesium-transporting ATPase (P-type)
MNEDPKQIQDLFSSIDSIMEYLIPIGILLAVIFVIIGGYMWIASAGNPEKVKQAQGTLTWAIIGLIFILIVGLLLRTVVDSLIGL